MVKMVEEVSQEDEPVPRISNKMQSTSPTFTKRHISEGFALDWSKIKQGQLATGVW